MTTKSAVCLPTAFRPSLLWKFPRNRPIFPRFRPQNPGNLTFFPRIIRSPDQMGRMSCSETSAFSQVNSYFLRKIDLVQLRIIFPCKPFSLFISWVKTYPCLIPYQLNGSERISTMYLKTVIFRHSILDNSSIPLTPAKQRPIFYQNITDWRRISQCRTKLHCMVCQE